MYFPLQVLQRLTFLGAVHPPRSDGCQLDGTASMVPWYHDSVGPVPKIHGPDNSNHW
jgi:hypothetical protein